MNAIVASLSSFIDRATAIPMTSVDRFVGLLIALPSWTVLGIARWLDPSPLGYGTHTQLGLGGCTMLTLTGWPCPMCGMTTTFALLAHGRVGEAFLNQPFGPVLFACTVAGAILGTVDLVGAVGALRRALEVVQRREQLYAIFLLLGLVAGWIFKSVALHPTTFGIAP